MKQTPYADYDVLAEWDHWDERTQRVVRARLENVPSRRFFDEREWLLVEALAELVLPQPDRAASQRVPLVPFIDKMLDDDDTDGFRHPGEPWPQQLWRDGLHGIDEASTARFGRPFLDLRHEERLELIATVAAGHAEGAAWQRAPQSAFFKELVQQVASVYYAHPAAWSEIGWGGPASPRGYVRTGYAMRDPWEPKERRQVSSLSLVTRENERSLDGGSGQEGGGTH